MKIWKYAFLLMALSIAVLWLAVISLDSNLRIIVCDVGQGDAILASYGSVQILIDGGANNKVIGCLSRNMPFWDRKIDVVILTHPQKDHYTGLIDVFKRYEVTYYLRNDLNPGDEEYQVLNTLVGGSNTEEVSPEQGFKLGNDMIYLDILWPFQDYFTNQNKDTKIIQNKYSIVLLLSFGDFKALLTGDIDQDISQQLINSKKIDKVIFLKVPHHGSKNGLSESLLREADPELAVISVGKNSYGHPHKEVLDLLTRLGTETLRTDIEGEIELVSDGKKWWRKGI